VRVGIVKSYVDERRRARRDVLRIPRTLLLIHNSYYVSRHIDPGAACCAIWSFVSALILAVFGTLMKKQPDYVITIKEDVYDAAPGQIYGAAGIYVALICVASGFWLWHDFKDPESTFFVSNRRRYQNFTTRHQDLDAASDDSSNLEKPFLESKDTRDF